MIPLHIGLADAAGLPAMGEFHVLRRSFASHLHKMGTQIKDVRDLLGHAELTTTNLYADSVSNSQEIIGRLDHIGKPANPRKKEGLTEGEVR